MHIIKKEAKLNSVTEFFWNLPARYLNTEKISHVLIIYVFRFVLLVILAGMLFFELYGTIYINGWK